MTMEVAMGVERMHPPKYWRMRAEEFRTKADDAVHAQTRETLRKVAREYDDLARRSERIRTLEDLQRDAAMAASSTAMTRHRNDPNH
jgi:hypothetical protein